MPLLSKRTAIIATFVVAFLLFGVNLAMGSYYLDKVYPGVRVSNLSLGGLTRSQARTLLEQKTAQKTVTLRLDQQVYTLKPADFGAEYQLDLTLDDAMAVGHNDVLQLLGLVKSFKAPNVKYTYIINQTKLQAYVKKLTTTQAEASIDASVQVVDGVPKVNPDRNGVGIDPDKLAEALEASLVGSSDINISKSYVKANIKAQDALGAVESAKAIIALPITLKYQDKSFIPTKKEIGQWLKFDKADHSLVANIDVAKVRAYIASVAKSIDVAPVNKKINVVNGEVKGEEGGSDGLAIDQDVLIKAISDMVPVKNPVALNITTHPVAFKTEYNRTVNLDSATRYIEINLSMQRLWAYQDHNVVFQSPITSGATGAGFPTIQGLFSIYGKERNRNLNGRAIGYNYNVFVQYWMPFSGNYGLHDASWRSAFGGQDYYYGGSHGCVNLPLETAAWLYNWADLGTPVWVHS